MVCGRAAAERDHQARSPATLSRGEYEAEACSTRGGARVLPRKTAQFMRYRQRRPGWMPAAAAAYWADQGWLATDPTAALRRRRPRPDRARALGRAAVEELLTRENIPLRERALWRMLYETAARAAEALGLDVPDLDLPNRRARAER